MAIKDLLIPNYLNELEQQDADTENTRSASALNNAQSSRILQLLPGELQQQGIQTRGMMLDNTRKEVDIEGQEIINKGNSILNNLNILKQTEQQLNNEKLGIDLKYHEVKTQQEIEAQKAQINMYNAQAHQAYSANKLNLQKIDESTRQMFLTNEYPKAAASISAVTDLVRKGDFEGANKLYQGMMKTLSPEFMQYEGRQGMDMLGPEITKEDGEILEIYSRYLEKNVANTSQMGQLAQQELANEGALNNARARASGSTNPLDDEKKRLDIQKAKEDSLAVPLMQSITGGTVNKGAAFNKDGELVAPQPAYAMHQAKKAAVKIMDAGGDPMKILGGQLVLEDAEINVPGRWSDYEEPLIVPRNDKKKEVFYDNVKERIEKMKVSPEEAYKQEIDAYISNLIEHVL